ncbi:MAG: EscU/YscU/HrcU family type III secretion system export apparatus switch protein [Candidatus Rifleibacteriota bacterium]
MDKVSEKKIRYEDLAVAIKYIFGREGEVPKVVASGRGRIAHRIIELARENEIPVRENAVLAESLAKVPVGVEIPPELWEAMAEILVQLYILDQQGKRNYD